LLHPYQLYHELAQDKNLSAFLSFSLHTAVAPESSELWLKLHEEEFEGVEAEERIDGLACMTSDDVACASRTEMEAEVSRLTELLAKGV
jgi:hypothetical protein